MKAKAPLEKFAPTSASLQKFVNSFLESDWDMKVCSFKFLHLSKNGTYHLIASLDVNGRHSCNKVVVIGKKEDTFELLHDWQVWGVADISRVLTDLRGTKQVQLVLPQSWSRYESSRCLATWQRVYSWQDGHFVEQSSSYPELYKARLKFLENRMAMGNDPVCDQMEVDKIARFFGNPRAGYARAEAWMKSSDASLRRKAAAVFADINDTDSKSNLKELKGDSNPLVAETARLYLEPSR